MRNFGHAIAAFTIWAATAAALAQTQPARLAAAPPETGAATDNSAVGAALASDPAAGEPAAGAPVDDDAGGPVVGDPIGDEPAVGAPPAGAPVDDNRATSPLTGAASMPIAPTPTPPAPSSIAPTPTTPMSIAPTPVAPVTIAPATPTPPVVAAPAGPPPMVAVPEAVYVTNFIAVPAGAPPSGLLAHLRAALHAHSAGRNAGLVAQAVVQRLSHAGVAARYLAPDEPPPVQGWLIGGVFELEGSQAPAASDGVGPSTEGLGAQVSVTVSDLEHGADTPFAIIGAPPDATGEADKWHPYVVPAKLSFERADRNAAVAALAQQIADTFVGNMTALRQADARAIAP